MSLLRDRDFLRFFGAQAISQFGDRMVTVALAFAVIQQRASPTAVGTVLAMRALPLIACLLIGGVVADRTSRRTVLVAADLVRLVSQGSLAAWLIAGRPSVLAIGILAGVTGAGSGFAAPATTGLLPEVVGPQKLAEANGLRATAFSAGELGGPLLSGVLVAAAGPGWALGIDALTFAASAALLVGLPRVERARAPESARFIADLRAGWDAFRSRRWLWTFVLWASVANLFFGAWKVLGPVVAHRDLGGAAAWGVLVSAMGVGTVAGGVLALRLRPGRPMLLVAALAPLFAAPMVALAVLRSVPVIAIGTLVAGLGMMLGNTLWETTLQRHVPPESLSRVSSYDWFGSLVLDPIGLAVWGPVAGVIGIEASLWTAAGLLVATALGLLSVPEIRRLRASPPNRPAPDQP
ncbi:MAG: MFS transporter [Solirubrobacterales bacterium]|nr:MFS transporter [Solirubrobacterales bacterium]